MSRDTCLANLLGYDFFLFGFTLSLLLLPVILLRYMIILVVCYLIYRICVYIWLSFVAERVQGQGRGVLITGCDSGFGFMFAQRLDALGFTVFAGCLSDKSQGAKLLSKTTSRRFHVIECDVTKDKQVANAIAYIRRHLPKEGLWAIVNNAGIIMNGLVELTTIELLNKAMDVNFYGTVRVTKEVLPLIRHSKGRIVNISSIHGRMARPGRFMYEASKHALETYSDSLRLEMTKFDVRVCLVEPGCFAHVTSIKNESHVKREKEQYITMWDTASDNIKKAYKKDMLMDNCTRPQGSWPPDEVGGRPVIDAVEDALCSPWPKSRYLVWGEWIGYNTHLTSTFYNFVPTWLMDRYILWWSK